MLQETIVRASVVSSIMRLKKKKLSCRGTEGLKLALLMSASKNLTDKIYNIVSPKEKETAINLLNVIGQECST